MKKFLIGFLSGVVITSVPLALAYSGVFSDVTEGQWYTEAVETLADLGIIEGYSDGTYKPGNNISRAETAVILNRVLEFIEYNYDQFPITEAGESFESNFMVCKSAETGLRIYHSYWCGDDSCWSKYYNYKGEIIELSNEYGPGTANDQYHPATKTTNCQYTTEEYFKSKVQ